MSILKIKEKNDSNRKNFPENVNKDNDKNNGIPENHVRKITRKKNFRKTIDYNSSVLLYSEKRLTTRKFSKRDIIQPDVAFKHLVTPPNDSNNIPLNSICLKQVRASINKNKCPIYTVRWTPDGRRLITGSSSGEFTLWNGLTFNFETIMQAHDDKIKAMKWSKNEEWLISADESGMVKYWQSNLNDVKVFQAHKEPIRALDFGPTDNKFVTCSADNTLRVWDFLFSKEERVLRGHGSDVTSVVWHPTKSLLISGSRDIQQPVKLWDPKSGQSICTLYCHKSVCLDVKLNKNGNLFLTASKDYTVKLFDIRKLSKELQIFRGHTKDVNEVSWHPIHESLFVSGSADGVLKYWMVGIDQEIGSVVEAHENGIWSLDWHPIGHILASGSNDFSTKFWTRNVPGDISDDHVTINQNNIDKDKSSKISDFDKIFNFNIDELSTAILPDAIDNDESDSKITIEPISRVIPKQFELNWGNNQSRPIALNTPLVPKIIPDFPLQMSKGQPQTPFNFNPYPYPALNRNIIPNIIPIPNYINQIPNYINQIPNYINQIPNYINQFPNNQSQANYTNFNQLRNLNGVPQNNQNLNSNQCGSINLYPLYPTTNQIYR